MERFEEYLGEVDKRMAGRVDEFKREELIAELRSHLALSLRAGEEESGMERPEAVRASLRGLGAPEIVAEDLIRQVTGRSSKSSWRLARWPMGLDLLAYFALPAVLLCLPLVYRDPSLLAISGWLGLVSLIWFCRAVHVSRRWLIKPMATAILGGFVAYYAICFSPQYQSLQREAMSKVGAAPDKSEQLAELEAKLKLAQLGAPGLRSNPALFLRGQEGYAAPMWVDSSMSYEAPYSPATVQLSTERILTLGRVRTLQEAEHAWKLDGEKWRSQLLQEREQILRPTAGPLDWQMLTYICLFPVSRLSVLCLANWGLLALSGRMRRRAKDRFARS